MRISATGNANHCGKADRGSSGFTLIEIMVVMVVIALGASIVVLSLPSGQPSLRDEAEKLAARLTLVAETAPISSTMTGVEITSTGYRLATRSLGAWVDHKGLGAPGEIYRWPEGVSLSLRIEGQQTKVLASFTQGDQRAPDIFFLPSGEQSPFKLLLDNGDENITITADAIGPITVNSERY